MSKNSPTQSNRRGAALIVAIVLLAVLGIVAGIVLPQILRTRREAQQDLIRAQSRQLLDDVLRNAEQLRESDTEFSGGTFTLRLDLQPFSGTFHVTTRLEGDVFVAEVEYHDENDRIRVRERKLQ